MRFRIAVVAAFLAVLTSQSFATNAADNKTTGDKATSNKTTGEATSNKTTGDKPAGNKTSGDKLYTVADGNKVDENTLKGWRLWRSQACERCHGANQEGAVGPSLIDSLKRLSKDEFKEVILKGRVERGMPNFNGSPQVVENVDHLYAYLKGRSDGAIKPGRVEAMNK